MNTYASLTDVDVTVAAMRAAADLIEQSGIAGLTVTCSSDQITIQVSSHLGDAHARCALVATLAEVLGSTAYRDDSPHRALAWLLTQAHVRGIPVRALRSSMSRSMTPPERPSR